MKRILLGLLLLGITPVGASAGDKDVVTVGDNLVIKGIPEIPRDLARRLNQYQNMRSASLLSWIPGNGGMLVSTRFGETNQVHRVTVPGGKRFQLTFFDERVAWARHCPRRGCKYFLFGKDVGGSEAYQIYRYDLDTGRHVMLTDGKSRNMEAVWSRKGDRVAWSSTKRDGRNFDIYIMDPENPGSQRLLTEVEGMWLPVQFSPDDKQLILLHYVSINESHLHLVDVETGKRVPLTPEGEKGVSYPSARFSKNGKKIFLTTDRDSEFVRLAVVNTRAKKFSPRFLAKSIPWDVAEFEVSPDGKSIAFVINENGFGRLYLVSSRGGKPRRVPGVPDGVIMGLNYQRDERLLGFTVTGNRTPGDVFVYDPRGKKVRRWTHSETGGLDASAFVQPERIEYPTFDQVDGKPRKIPALLYRPQGKFKPPYPIIVSIHGGPEGQARPYALGQYNYWLNELGVAIVRPNVRGSAGYGKSYLLMDNGMKREDTVRDIGALLDWIQTRKDLDPERIAVTGGSYGGYMSLATMTHYSDRLRCGMDYVGISNFVTFLKNTKDYRRDLRRAEYGDERDPEMEAYLQKISPLTNAEKIKVPLLVIQGANDPRVPASEAEQIVERVEKAGGQVWYLLAKDEGHGFAKKKNRDYLGLAMIKFVQEFLLNQD